MVPRLVADRLVLLNCPPPSCRCFASNGLFDDLPLWCRDERVADVGGAGQDLPLQIHVDGDGDPYVVACCHLPFCNARPLTNHALFNTGFSFSSNRAPLPLLPSPLPCLQHQLLSPSVSSFCSPCSSWDYFRCGWPVGWHLPLRNLGTSTDYRVPHRCHLLLADDRA